MSQDPIGSIRHLRGTDCKALTVCITTHCSMENSEMQVAIAMDWPAVTTEHETTVSRSFEGRNATFDYCPVTWQKVNHVEAVVSHRCGAMQPTRCPCPA